MLRTEEIAQAVIHQWHSLALTGTVEHNNIFFQFMAAWVAFNAQYNWFCKYEARLGDKQKLLEFVREDVGIDRLHRELLVNNTQYKNAVVTLKAKGIRDVSRNRLVEISDESRFEDVILCVYQVRNNLFHGDKIVNNARDETVVRASFEIVSNFMEQYMNPIQP
jgi:hypothetical protein